MSKNLLKEVYTRAKRACDTLVNHSYEKPDPVPMAPPVGYTPTPPLEDLVRTMITGHLLREAAAKEGFETFDEADDFEVGEDYDPRSPYEEVFDPVDEAAKNKLREEEASAMLDARLKEMRPRKEKDDGTSNVDEGRVAASDGGSRGSDKKRKGKPKSEQNADDGGSVSEADSGVARVDE